MFSSRICKMNNSIFFMNNKTMKQREKNGIKFFKLNMGQPDLNTDCTYFKALSKYNKKVNSYGDPSGLCELRDCVCGYYNRLYNGLSLNNENIVVTQGASDAIIKLLYSICDINDEIIILEPFFTDYKMYCNLLNIKIKYISWNSIYDGKLEKIISTKTKAILFSNPNNPDGAICDIQFCNKLLEVSKKNNILIISDEVYSGLIYDKSYVSFANYLDNNVVVIDSASKKLNLCGSRIGYIISKNKDLNKKIVILNDCRISISNVEQFAVSKMLKNADKIIEDAKKIYQNRIKIVLNKTKNTQIKCIVPHGGITIILEMPFDTKKYVKWLIEKYEKDKSSLLVISADNFYNSSEGNNKIRICITSDDIDKAMDLLVESCNKYMEDIL